ncbi:hypothetical protein [Erythrobacter alti]|uniref:DUF3617 domain-containing protein n=1 Tax=Erythrobacter alti TaxID=1896145 RepID=UPI0030F4AF67
MPRTRIALLLALPLLSGCFGDNPDNVPLRGEWQLVKTLDSVTLDGMTFSADQIPAELRNFEGTETRCGEPLYTDADWQSDDIANRTGGMCELETYTHDGDSAEYAGICTIEQAGGSYTPSLTGYSRFDETSSRDVVTMEGTITLPGDATPHVLKMIAVQEGTRIGDC